MYTQGFTIPMISPDQTSQSLCFDQSNYRSLLQSQISLHAFPFTCVRASTNRSFHCQLRLMHAFPIIPDFHISQRYSAFIGKIKRMPARRLWRVKTGNWQPKPDHAYMKWQYSHSLEIYLDMLAIRAKSEPFPMNSVEAVTSS